MVAKKTTVPAKSKVVIAFEKEMSLTDQGLTDLKNKKKSLVFDASTDDGFTALRKERTEMNKILETIKRAAIDTNGLITKRRKELEGEVIKIFQKNVTVFEVEDKRRKDEKLKAQILEEERLNKIKTEILKIGNFAEHLEGKPSTELSEIIEAVDLIDISECFAELTQEAMQTKNETLMKLNMALVGKLKDEEFEAKQEQQEIDNKKLQDANAEFEKEKIILGRISKLAMIPIEMINQSSFKINKKIEAIIKVEISEDVFGAHQNQAEVSKQTVLDQLDVMYQNQSLVERAQSVQSEPEQKLDQSRDLEQEMLIEAEHEQQAEFIGADMASGKDETVTAIFADGGYVPLGDKLQQNQNQNHECYTEKDQLLEGEFEILHSQTPKNNTYNMHEDFENFCNKHNLNDYALVELSVLLHKHYNL